MSISISSFGTENDLETLGVEPVVMQFRPLYKMTPEEYYKFACQNPDLRIERTSAGEIVLMTPTGAGSGYRNSNINMQLCQWAEAHGGGITFDSSTEFELPNGAARSPDASWVRLDRWNVLSKSQRKKFAPLCPDFVVELRSESDRLNRLKAKMEEYLSCGAQLGWLIDPLKKQVHVYRPGFAVEIIDNPDSINADPMLPGFTLQLKKIMADE